MEKSSLKFVERALPKAKSLMTTLNNSKFRLLLASRLGKSHSTIAKGFTLVELLVVIVIVGILSAIALPNFLSQSDKAKATEAKTISSAYLKQTFAAYQEGGTTSEGTGSITCPDNTKYFSYACATISNTDQQIVATGLTTAGNLASKSITSSVKFATGAVTIGNAI
jgi:type IV pilus assembly protein PilA